MPYLIKATDNAGIVGWLSISEQGDFRHFESRNEAVKFATAEEAQRVIELLPKTFSKVGIHFSIEPETNLG